jgi:hypothetical protein
MSSQHDTERLHEVFTEAAYDVVPSPVPLAAIVRAGRARRRRTVAITAFCGLLLIPLAATAARLAAPGPDTTLPSASTQYPITGTTTLRVVAPGERVQPAPGVRLWLTRDGEHLYTPDSGEVFHSATDGNLARPGASVQTESAKGHAFVSGLYTGNGDPARVTVVTSQGTFTGTLVHLPGHPGWGAWYIPATIPFTPTGAKDLHLVHTVTITDTTGRTIATFNSPIH